MRVLVIAPHSFYIDRGSPIDVDLLVRALTMRGDKVDLVVYRDGADRAYEGLTIYRAQTPKWLSNIGPGFSAKKLLADLWLFRMAKRLVQSHTYDVIHAGEEAVFFAMWFRFAKRVPYVYDMDSSIAQQLVEKKTWLSPFSGFFNLCEARAIRGAVAVAPVCNALAELAHKRGAKSVTTLHDISQLTPGDFGPGADVRGRFSPQAVVMLYVGNLEKYQGVDLLLESMPAAVAKCPALELVIAGGTQDLIETYRKKAERLGVGAKIHFIGPWPSSKLGELLAQADILVAPRIKGINTPMKVFPYLHSGRAVLVTDLPTHTQILNNSICELAGPEPDRFAEGIVRLASDPERRAKLGRAGQQFAEQNHTFKAHCARVNELYRGIERAVVSKAGADNQRGRATRVSVSGLNTQG